MSASKLGTDIHFAVDQLKNGGVLAYPAEACFGLGCDAQNEAAVMRILQLKKRSVEKGLIVIASSLKTLMLYIDWAALSADQKNTIQSTWPGASTWLIPVSADCPTWLSGKHDTLAVRIPEYAPMRALCEQFDGVLVSTSANLQTQPALKTALACQQCFGDTLDYIV
ncbi:MAG: Sua5/YciO/YrdC/YwlC family protein, partial [Arenicellales bacterium]